MGYFITAVVAFFVGCLFVGGTTYWYLKEFKCAWMLLRARLERLQNHQDEILTKVENKRWWETLLSDIYNTAGEVDKTTDNVI